MVKKIQKVLVKRETEWFYTYSKSIARAIDLITDGWQVSYGRMAKRDKPFYVRSWKWEVK